MNSVYYVCVTFFDGTTVDETYKYICDARDSFNAWSKCFDAEKVTLEVQCCLDMYKAEDDNDED